MERVLVLENGQKVVLGSGARGEQLLTMSFGDTAMRTLCDFPWFGYVGMAGEVMPEYHGFLTRVNSYALGCIRKPAVGAFLYVTLMGGVIGRTSSFIVGAWEDDCALPQQFFWTVSGYDITPLGPVGEYGRQVLRIHHSDYPGHRDIAVGSVLGYGPMIEGDPYTSGLYTVQKLPQCMMQAYTSLLCLYFIHNGNLVCTDPLA